MANTMTSQGKVDMQAPEMHDGEDFVCSNCGCEIMLKHHGDPAKMQRMTTFTCCCGTPMHPEHAQSKR